MCVHRVLGLDHRSVGPAQTAEPSPPVSSPPLPATHFAHSVHQRNCGSSARVRVRKGAIEIFHSRFNYAQDLA